MLLPGPLVRDPALVRRRHRMGIHRVVAHRLGSPLDVRGVPATTLACQGDPLRAGRHEQVPHAPAPRYPLNRAGPARRADQVGVLPIRRDQRQRFRRPILLNAASPHVLRCTSDRQSSPSRKGGQSSGDTLLDTPGPGRISQRRRRLPCKCAPTRVGFTLTGRGRDRAPYQLGLRFEMPLDSRTRVVLGELLSQAELTIARRTPPPRGTGLRARRRRADRP
jgi:hypothetical protein